MCVQLLNCAWLFNSVNCSSLGSSVNGIPQVKMLEWVVIFSSSDLRDPGIKPQVIRIITEPPGKPHSES